MNFTNKTQKNVVTGFLKDHTRTCTCVCSKLPQYLKLDKYKHVYDKHVGKFDLLINYKITTNYLGT